MSFENVIRHADNTYAPFTVWRMSPRYEPHDNAVKDYFQIIPDSDSANLATAINIADRQEYIIFTDIRIFDNEQLKWVS